MEFVQMMKAAVRERWGGSSGRDGMGAAEQYPSIVNERHYKRVTEGLDEAKRLGCEVIAHIYIDRARIHRSCAHI